MISIQNRHLLYLSKGSGLAVWEDTVFICLCLSVKQEIELVELKYFEELHDETLTAYLKQ